MCYAKFSHIYYVEANYIHGHCINKLYRRVVCDGYMSWMAALKKLAVAQYMQITRLVFSVVP